MPPVPPFPPPPPGSPGTLHWGRAFIGIALLAAIFYGIPMVPGLAPAVPVDDPKLDDWQEGRNRRPKLGRGGGGRSHRRR